PVTGQHVSITVSVQGTATDKNFLQYVLEAGAGDPAPAFAPISGPMTHQVENRALGVWDVGALTGPHTLRLAVEDKAGNVATAPVVVEVRSPDLIEKLAATPDLFSPNGDGVKETSVIAFRLKRESRVTLEIRDRLDAVVRKPFDDALLLSGDHAFVWDGTGIGGEAPDGAYVAVLLATDATLPALSEEAAVTLTLDRVPPALRIDSLTEGAFAPLPLDVTGAVTDPLLKHFLVELGPEAGALALLQSGSESVTGVLAPIVDFPDGAYRLKLSAEDLAGNASEISLGFTADSTMPALSLNAPEEGAFLRRDPVPVRVEGNVAETNLESYLLEFGLGSPPRSLVPLAGGASIPPEGVSADWAIADFPDGLYTLKLSARDRAQNASELVRLVTLDKTPPTVQIDEPREGAFVTGRRPIQGTAFDESFTKATIEIAPGLPAEAFQFTKVSELTAPVREGELHPGLVITDGDYTLRLTATDRAGNEASALRRFTLDTRRPDAPAGLVAEVKNRTDVRLRWAQNAEPDLAGYLVLRGTVQVNAAPVTATELVDMGRPEGVWVYTVKAVDRAGLLSDPSAPADARIDLTPPRVALVSPEDGASIRGLVDVVGTAFAETDFREYRLTFARVEAPDSPTLLKRSPLPENFATLVQWDATLLEGTLLLRLEAEDTSGNVGSAESRVTVDNRAPSPPVLVRVTTPA
ncbi:MAG: Ig-like domain-containing protein, partial [Vicinamibacteria bacterium]